MEVLSKDFLSKILIRHLLPGFELGTVHSEWFRTFDIEALDHSATMLAFLSHLFVDNFFLDNFIWIKFTLPLFLCDFDFIYFLG